jgi:polyribonucleotide nucleotidyltransferase
MFVEHKNELNWGGRKLTMETGKIARQADGAVVVHYGETMVLCTAVAQRTARQGIDFFPLTVNYEEKTYAAGKIPGGFFKREGRPGEKETLTSRLIDRPIRPLFAKGFRNETQVICTVLSHDLENDPDIPAMIGASAALTISGIPFLGPIGGARVGYIDGEYVLNPNPDQREASALDLIVAGTADGVLMVESQAHELSEEIMLGAVSFGHRACWEVIDAIVVLAESCAKEAWAVAEPDDHSDLEARLSALIEDDLRAAYAEPVKQARVERLDQVRERAVATLETDTEKSGVVAGLFKNLERAIVRGNVLKTSTRIDGRDTRTVRPIVAEVGCLPRAHGSALFTRGETQALVATTLGTGDDEQIMDVLEGEYREHFMLHYNFPPYSVGEAKFLRGPGRREIGHGKLAWRALRPLMPSKDDFPYTIRVVSDITESNGSSSMATVCGASLSLMDAAVPLKCPVAGIAMGLILEDGEYAVLSDILGDEDHLGDMDFKVAGTADGITALQMDIKVTGVTEEIMGAALAQAREGRMGILDKMADALSTARGDIHAHAPRITKLSIPKDKIREVIGTGGKVIREICEVSGAKIDVEDDGTVKVAATNTESGEKAVQMIRDIVAEPEIGTVYTGKVVKVLDFGAFVNFIGNRDGLVHISELAAHRVAKVTDVVNEGDEVKVKVLAVDDRGKVRLSIKAVQAEAAEAEGDAAADDHEAVS